MGTRIAISLALLVAAGLLVLGLACGEEVDPVEAAMPVAEEIYTQRCVVCHGVDGAGDGENASTLDPQPRDYRDAGWQDATADTAIQNAILLGGTKVGLSAEMPANTDLSSRPYVVAALTQIIRGFRDPSHTVPQTQP